MNTIDLGSHARWRKQCITICLTYFFSFLFIDEAVMTYKIPHSWLLFLMVLLLLSTFSTLRRHIPFPVLLQTVISECTSFFPPLYCLYYSVVLECVICISIRKEFAVIRGDNIICCGHWQVFIRCYEEYMYSFVLLSSFVHIHILL
ncbi:hypothetical protein BDA99DRAFT_302496 [Phascolomyces articulosus]|uniref:Uncharacterized protein n=1 Tax=Phascolomyces articulosus TaxID=60185 RepID=A0AAD5PGS9_9FUNG|nr:hypothetical protein BDA99DRAFT_302496 [Phascolomyces articulosus]